MTEVQHGLDRVRGVSDGLQHLIFRLLSLWGLMLLGVESVEAQIDSHHFNWEALTHCTTAKGECEAQVPAIAGDVYCKNAVGGSFSCTAWPGTTPTGRWSLHRISTDSGLSDSQCAGIIERHGYCEEDPEPVCEDPPGLGFTHYPPGVVGGTFSWPPSICVGLCIYDFSGSGGGQCVFEDSNGNGIEDAGEPFSCPTPYVNTGGTCPGVEGHPGDPLPAGNNVSPGTGEGSGLNCQNTNCGPNPSPGGGGDGEPVSGGPLPGQDPPGGPTAPGGDGDPSTPTPGGGDGTGDITGPGGVPDGQRDIDCNPQSNPDCGFTGSATGAGTCEVQPSCSGNPVDCAILYQNWAAMCYDGGEITNPSDCRQPIQCEGDVLMCEAIAQERNQYCAKYHGDGSIDTYVFDDADFERDLKEEAEEIDIEESLDQSGFATGACPAPASVETGFGGVSISIAPFCSLAEFIKPMVVIGALMLGIFIVVRGGKN